MVLYTVERRIEKHPNWVLPPTDNGYQQKCYALMIFAFFFSQVLVSSVVLNSSAYLILRSQFFLRV